MIKSFKLTQEYIHLNQLMKIMGWAMSGGEANLIIDEGLIKVNDEIELRRRNKLYKGYKITYGNQIVEIE